MFTSAAAILLYSTNVLTSPWQSRDSVSVDLSANENGIHSGGLRVGGPEARL